MTLTNIELLPAVSDAMHRLLAGESTEAVAERLEAAGIMATAVDGETIRLDGYVAVAVEGGEWEARAGVDPETAAMELLDDEEGYYTNLDRPCVISAYTAPVLLDAGGVRPGDEKGWSRLLQQSEPDCTRGEHDWVADGKDCGTWAGPNGGVTIIDKCRYCGCLRTHTTIWQYTPDGSLWNDVYEYEEAQ